MPIICGMWKNDSLIEPILAGDPAFSAVTIHEKSDGGLYLGGDVSAHLDHVRLEQTVAKAIGQKRARCCGERVRETEVIACLFYSRVWRTRLDSACTGA